MWSGERRGEGQESTTLAAATDLAAEACVPMPFTSSMPAWSSPSSNLWLALEQGRLHWGGGSAGLREWHTTTTTTHVYSSLTKNVAARPPERCRMPLRSLAPWATSTNLWMASSIPSKRLWSPPGSRRVNWRGHTHGEGLRRREAVGSDGSSGDGGTWPSDIHAHCWTSHSSMAESDMPCKSSLKSSRSLA